MLEYISSFQRVPIKTQNFQPNLQIYLDFQDIPRNA